MLRMQLYIAPLACALAAFGASPSLAITITTIDVPGAFSTRPQGIFGDEVVGTYIDASHVEHAYLQIVSSFTTIAVPASLGKNTNPRDMNSNGDIAGYYTG